jgi:hypothetical protein
MSYSAQFLSQTNLCGTMNTKDLGPMVIACAVASHSGSAAMSHCAQYFATKKTNLSMAGTNRGRGAFVLRPPRGVKCTATT